ncbi:MAG TPA: hypothetical protein VJ654_02940 [Noviherbaspirillum sp.]|nr:hypothetical protein [Noviherbaspirillum sp.]
MTTIRLQTEVTESPDFSGFKFYVEAGREFDLSDYCEAYNLNADDVEEQGHGGYKAVQDEAARLYPGEWLAVSHKTDE